MSLDQIIDMYNVVQNSTDPVVTFSKIAIITLLFFLCVRHLFLGSLLHSIKRIDRNVYKRIRQFYIRHLALGWVFFLAALTVITLLFFKGGILLQYFVFDGWLLIAGFLFLLGIYFHLFVFAKALVTILQQKTEVEKN